MAKVLHPEIADLLQVTDLRKPRPFDDGSFNYVTWNAVIQHLSPEITEGTTLPELTRVLAPNGVLQLMFKIESGAVTVEDRPYGTQSVTRTSSMTNTGCWWSWKRTDAL